MLDWGTQRPGYTYNLSTQEMKGKTREKDSENAPLLSTTCSAESYTSASRSIQECWTPSQPKPTNIVSVVFLADIRKTLTLPENKNGQILLELSIAVFPNAAGNGEGKKSHIGKETLAGQREKHGLVVSVCLFILRLWSTCVLQ